MTINVTSHMTPAAQKRKKGFTLTEIAIVLGIIGLILGAIWTAAAAVYNNQRVAHANTAVLQIAQGVRTLYANSGSDVGLTIANLIKAKAVPSDLVNTAGTGLISPFSGGTIDVYAPATGDSFTVELTNVPEASCISLITAVAAGRDPGLFAAKGLAAAGAAALATVAPTMTPAITTPINADLAVGSGFGGCNANTPGVVAVDFGFSLK